jgi:hypothetical protein
MSGGIFTAGFGIAMKEGEWPELGRKAERPF